MRLGRVGGGGARAVPIEGSAVAGVWSRAAGVSGDAVLGGGAARAVRIKGFRSDGPLVAGGGRERGCSWRGGGGAARAVRINGVPQSRASGRERWA